MSQKNDSKAVNEADSKDRKVPLWKKPITRRAFLAVTGAGAVGTILVASGMKEVVYAAKDVYSVNAKGMIIGDPTRCVGCRRCELACSEFNDGKAQPSLSRIKVARNYSFGVSGVRLDYWRGDGKFGNQRIVQDTCRQCPHPVPCKLACPYDAIEVVGPVNARVINQEKCQGCRTCQKACPWGMTSFDEELKKATKCHLCDGDPECVKACPAGALRYVPWQDLTTDIPARFVVPAYVGNSPAALAKAASCNQCH
jgi:Fe-S-cluster-containing dehydrogenase component